MVKMHKGTFLNLTTFLVGGLFLSVSVGYASVDLDLSNKSDRPVVLKGFSRNYSDLSVTTDMEFDPDEDHKFRILIQYDRFVQYCEKFRGNGGVKQEAQDFVELTVGGDDFIVSWDERLVVFLKKAHADLYDINIELIPTDDFSKKKYKLTLTNKPG